MYLHGLPNKMEWCCGATRHNSTSADKMTRIMFDNIAKHF